MRQSSFSSRYSKIALMVGLIYSSSGQLTHATPIISIPQKHSLITQKVNDKNLITLHGNTRPEVTSGNDRGPVADNFRMDHMLLQLKRPDDLEQALELTINQLHDPHSPNFHHWLTPAQFGQYGLSQADLTTITNWLISKGFTVNNVLPNGLNIDFSGTAGQVRAAFGTSIHHLSVNGTPHIANISDPQIPQALAPAIVGIVSLHDFVPRNLHQTHQNYTYTTQNSTYTAVTPSDLATIYNFNPLFSQGYTGKNQSIAVIENTDLYNPNDWSTFRSTFGLSGYTSGSLATIHPVSSGTNNCGAPGVIAGNDGEAILDAEWASAAAPDANIQVVSCADTQTTFGGLIAMQNIVNYAAQPPAIMSISYGECEAENGAASNAAFSSIYQQAVAQGISVFVSSGDEGAAGCDPNSPAASHGIAVNALASTPYNVAVGGTDFGDTYAKTSNTYWSNTNNASYGSALSYIPEIPWNDSCASTLIANYLGYSTTYGIQGFCSSMTGMRYFRTTASGSGGPSGCATGSPTMFGTISGSCKGYSKPSWQSGVAGIPNDGVRDLPDVSLFAANGVWGHYYVFCWSNTQAGGTSCSGAPSSWSGAGGTSFSSPILAGIQALVNQKSGSLQGNPNYAYYKMAASQYGATGNSSCNSSLGNGIASSCIFNDVTLGDMDVDCIGTWNCYRPSGFSGVLSTSNSSYAKAYGTTTGWDFATGIGTVNAYNLVTNWSN